MTIKLSWDTGNMVVDPEVLIREMPLTNYRKWLKLFIQYGKREDHIQMVNCLCDQLINAHNTIMELEAEFDHLKSLKDRFHADKRRMVSSWLRATKRQHKRIIKMWDALGGYLT
jgi:hypothetical protein